MRNQRERARRELPPRSIELWARGILPALRLGIEQGYFSFDVEGREHIPLKGPVVYVANHAGWAALDALFFVLAMYDSVGPRHLPYAIVEDLLVKTPGLRLIFKDMGVIPATWLRHPETLPLETDLFGVFPEGVAGNCKPFWKAYRMRPWKTGFVRLALLRKAKVVPVAILGGEESLPVLATIPWLKSYLGFPLPIPLSLLPLPSKWKVVFHDPIDFGRHDPQLYHDRRICQELANKCSKVVQGTLNRETASRPLRQALTRFIRG